MNRDTLSGVAIAVSSPPGRAARGLLRLTGEGLFENLGMVLDGEAADALVTRQQRVATTALPLREGRLPCLVIVLPGPGTFTGEDMIEFELPGNPALLASAETQLIDLLQVAGIDAHPAVAGEFTARAFLNGRISLFEAEYVAASIAARNHNELEAADHLRKNPIIKRTAMLIEVMRNILGRLEASIDFSDEADVVAITGTALGSEVQGVVDDLDALLDGHLGSEAPQELPRVVLAGPPNAGKSTLFNRLLDRSRVVVSNQPGTTRDAPAERVSLGERDVILVDTAGLEESLPTDGIDGAAQMATHRALDGASLIVHCTPVDVPAYPLNLLTDAPILAIRTKADVRSQVHNTPDELAISAKSGEGIALLGVKIAEFLSRAPDEALLASTTLLPRHQRELAAARAAAAEAIEILSKQPEVVAELLRTSLDHLAALEGGSDPEAVLDVVFSSFCIGK